MADGADELRLAVKRAEREAVADRAEETARRERMAREEQERDHALAELDRGSASAIAAFVETMRAAGNPGVRPCITRPDVPGLAILFFVALLVSLFRREAGQGWVITPAKHNSLVCPSYTTPGIVLLTDGRLLGHYTYKSADRVELQTDRGQPVPVDPRHVKVEQLAAILSLHRLSL